MTWVSLGVGLATTAYGADQANDARGTTNALARQQLGGEENRAQRIDTNIALVNQAFDAPNRQAQIRRFMQSLRGYYGDQVGRQKRDTSRKLKFALAGSGLTGGSVDADKHRQLDEDYADAALKAESRVQDETASLRGADEAARINLLNQARTGGDVGTNSSRALTSLQSNLANASNAARGQMAQDTFTNTTDTYRRIAERQARRQGYGYVPGRQDLYGGG